GGWQRSCSRTRSGGSGSHLQLTTRMGIAWGSGGCCYDCGPQARTEGGSRMVHRVVRGFGVAFLGVFLSASVALAGNPAGTAQPGASCGAANATVMPNGFGSGGFANAEAHYANDGSTGGLASGNAHVVSQYDVACYQLTLHAH